MTVAFPTPPLLCPGMRLILTVFRAHTSPYLVTSCILSSLPALRLFSKDDTPLRSILSQGIVSINKKQLPLRSSRLPVTPATQDKTIRERDAVLRL